MVEIDVLDLFCGCGGASAGFRSAELHNARYRIIGGADFDRYCVATYEKNLRAPGIQVDLSRVRTAADVKKLLAATQRKEENPLFLVGCAPCQAFSSHTKNRIGPDKRRSLLPQLAHIATLLNPEAILIENVPELLTDRNWGYFRAAKRTLEAHGYTIRVQIYNFAEFGLPQERFRAVVLAFKSQFEMPKPFLRASQFKTVRNAISNLPPLCAGQEDVHDPMHVTSKHRDSTINILRNVPKDGGNRPTGVGPKCLDNARGKYGGYTDVYGRLAWDRPALTITARCRTPSCGRFAHPEQNRGLSVREAALLQGFPPDFQFVGPFDDKFKQVGNAVPPLIAKFVAEHMYREFCEIEADKRISVDFSADIKSSIGPGFSNLINGIKKRRDGNGELYGN